MILLEKAYIADDKWLISLLCKENVQIDQKQTSSENEQRYRHRQVTEEKMQLATKWMKRCSSLLVSQGNAN